MRGHEHHRRRRGQRLHRLVRLRLADPSPLFLDFLAGNRDFLIGDAFAAAYNQTGSALKPVTIGPIRSWPFTTR